MKSSFWFIVMVIIIVLYFGTILVFAFTHFKSGEIFTRNSFLPMIGLLFLCTFMHIGRNRKLKEKSSH